MLATVATDGTCVQSVGQSISVTCSASSTSTGSTSSNGDSGSNNALYGLLGLIAIPVIVVLGLLYYYYVYKSPSSGPMPPKTQPQEMVYSGMENTNDGMVAFYAGGALYPSPASGSERYGVGLPVVLTA